MHNVAHVSSYMMGLKRVFLSSSTVGEDEILVPAQNPVH